MTVKRFVRKYVGRNSLIRLVERYGNGHRAVANEDGDTVGLVRSMQNGTGWQAKYAGRKVEGVTDILFESYPEAINIVMK